MILLENYSTAVYFKYAYASSFSNCMQFCQNPLIIQLQSLQK